MGNQHVQWAARWGESCVKSRRGGRCDSPAHHTVLLHWWWAVGTGTSESGTVPAWKEFNKCLLRGEGKRKKGRSADLLILAQEVAGQGSVL